MRIRNPGYVNLYSVLLLIIDTSKEIVKNNIIQGDKRLFLAALHARDTSKEIVKNNIIQVN
jgi:hypothetical protein